MKFPFALGGLVAVGARDMFLRAVRRAAGRREGPRNAEDVQSIGSAYCSGAIGRRTRRGLRVLHRSSHRAFCCPTEWHNTRPGAGGTLFGFELGRIAFHLCDQAWRARQEFDHQALGCADTQHLDSQRQQALGGRQNRPGPARPMLDHPRSL
jgi:hypothetical protein